jgi:two-component system, cell cycle response regulator
MTARTVLIVDDSRTIRALIKRALEDAGFRTVEAGDGNEALVRVRESPPDAILLDVDMPGLDGFHTLEAMNAESDMAEIPVLFLTARSAAEDAVMGLELGARDFIRKPCPPEELVARLRTTLALKAKQDKLQQALQNLRHLSATDALTGLANRRALDDLFAVLRTDSDVAHRALSVAVIDIDHFKQVNDREGHAVGDIALRVVAQRLRSVVPSSGLLGRWGGEEFVCVLPDLKLGAARQLAEEMRSAVRSTPVPIDDSRALELAVSIGIAAGVGAHAADVLLAADAAVYVAKRSGRDRVVSASAGLTPSTVD